MNHSSIHLINLRPGLECGPHCGVGLHRKTVVTLVAIHILTEDRLGLGTNAADSGGELGLDWRKREYPVLFLNHLDKFWLGHYVHLLPRQRHGEDGQAGLLTESGAHVVSRLLLRTTGTATRQAANQKSLPEVNIIVELGAREPDQVANDWYRLWCQRGLTRVMA